MSQTPASISLLLLLTTIVYLPAESATYTYRCLEGSLLYNSITFYSTSPTVDLRMQNNLYYPTSVGSYYTCTAKVQGYQSLPLKVTLSYASLSGYNAQVKIYQGSSITSSALVKTFDSSSSVGESIWVDPGVMMVRITTGSSITNPTYTTYGARLTVSHSACSIVANFGLVTGVAAAVAIWSFLHN